MEHDLKADPVTQFLECLYVNFDFEGAQDGLSAAVMHMTKSDVRYRAGPKYHPLTAKTLVAFWNDVVAGKVDALPSDEEGEEENDEL